MRQPEPYKPCDCGGDCVRWEEGNPNGCAGTAKAVGEYEVDDGEGGSDWYWAHGCDKHEDEVM